MIAYTALSNDAKHVHHGANVMTVQVLLQSTGRGKSANVVGAIVDEHLP